MDPSGRFIAGSYGPAPSSYDGSVTSVGGLPVLWDNGVGRVLPVDTENAEDVHVSGVNRHGWVIGGLRRPTGSGLSAYVAWISRDATSWEQLPTPAGYDGANAFDINDRGDVVGLALNAAGGDPVVWSPDGEGGWTPRVIDVATWNSTLAIADDGTVTMFVTGRQPYLWHPDGTEFAAPQLDLPWVDPVQVRGDWAVVVAGRTEGDSAVPVGTVLLRWNVRTGETSVIDTDVELAWPTATVNTRGDVAWPGTLRTHDGREYALPLPSDAQWLPDGPVAINEDATVIASTNGHLWRC